MPCFALGLYKLDAEQVLVDLQDGGYHDRDREVLLHELVVKAQTLLDELAVVIPVVPEVEFAVERQALLIVLPLLDRQERLAVLETDGAQLLLQLGEELDTAYKQSVTIRKRSVANVTSLTLFAFLTILTSVT